MKYYLIFIQVVFLCSGLRAQSLPSISGAAVVCPGDGGFYGISDSRCGLKTSIDWSITNGDIGDDSFEFIYVTWDDSDAESGNLKVSYNCWPTAEAEDIIVVENVTLNVNFRSVQVPFFEAPSKELPYENNSWFFLTTPDQGPGFTYSWSFPDCLPGIDGTNSTIVTPDLYATGSICLTVYNELCDTSITECIEITRSCEDSKIFTEFDPVPVFTSVGSFIQTSGTVVTTLPNVEFKAGESIDLNPGFFANAEFLAHIGECGRAPGSGDCIDPGTFEWFSGSELKGSEVVPLSKSTEVQPNKSKMFRDKDDIKMLISPNPAGDNFTIVINEFNNSQNYTFEILTLNGETLLRGQISDQRTLVDATKLGKGIYLVKVYTANDLSVERFVKY